MCGQVTVKDYKEKVMKKITLPYKVRAAIYVIVLLGTAVIVPLHTAGILSDVVFAVWTSVAGAASGLALLNVTPDKEV
jgi:hypothetical protein